MSFTFDARTVLELGKELISSDEVALYELIKNAVDAGSPKIEILVRSRLPHSDFREAIRQVSETQKKPQKVTTFIRAKIGDSEDPVIEALLERLDVIHDREEYRKILERDYRALNSITVSDTGEGMSLKDLRTIFLRIGTRNRRRQNESGQTKLGDKGIGRLSAMRLGETLCVKTTKAGETYWNNLEIDWRDFDVEDNPLAVNAETLAETIEIVPKRGEKKENTSVSGTTITIGDLSADWTWVRFNELLDGKIARFIDPFQAGLANRILVARHNGKRVTIPSVPKELLNHAHAVCKATFKFEGCDPVITGTIDYSLKQRSTVIEQKGAEVLSLASTPKKRRAKRGHAAFEETPLSIDVLKKLGQFDLEIFWYNRLIVEAIEDLTDSQRGTRQEIARWAGGPMLFRHGYRILPYGEVDDDWVSLDKVAFGVSGFKLNRQQVFGRVSIETPHKFLSEQTNREGLIQSEVSDALKRLVGSIVHNEFRNFINEVDDAEALQKRQKNLEDHEIGRAERALKKAVDILRKQLDGDHEAEIDDVVTTSGKLSEEAIRVMNSLDKIHKQSAQDREKFVYLAGVGLMTEFIFHELERAVAHTMSLISEGGASPKNISSLREQLKTLHKRIAAFDELTGEKRQTKSKFNLSDLITEVLANHEREFARHDIRLTISLPEIPYEVKAVRGMVIQIIENLVVNASYWLKRQGSFEEGFQPELRIGLDANSREVFVEDNGPGVPVSRKERIFQPFVTSKPAGMGKGLGLFIARDMAEYHNWTLAMDPKVGRERPGRLNRFVLEMT